MKRKPNKPLATFRVYPAGRYFYAIVNIWPNKKAMYTHRQLQRDHEASCTGQEAYLYSGRKKERKVGLFAELNFHRRFLGAGCVSHEMTHAALSWGGRVRLPLASIVDDNPFRATGHGGVLAQDGAEERLCRAQGEMVRQFTERCYKLRIYPLKIKRG
jgi:hypothetical protein